MMSSVAPFKKPSVKPCTVMVQILDPLDLDHVLSECELDGVVLRYRDEQPEDEMEGGTLALFADAKAASPQIVLERPQPLLDEDGKQVGYLGFVEVSRYMPNEFSRTPVRSLRQEAWILH